MPFNPIRAVRCVLPQIPTRALAGLLAGMLLLPAAPAAAQCSNYGITQTADGVINPGTTDIGNHCDDCVTPVNLPFPVSFYGRTYTVANCSSNGNIQFDNTMDDYANTCLPGVAPETRVTGSAIMPLWDDLRTDGGPGTGIFAVTSGVAPNRVFELEWRAVFYRNGLPVNFEVRFFESGSGFEIVYGAGGGADASSATIGAQPGSGGPASSLACNQAGLSLPAGTRLAFGCAAARFTYQGRLTDGGAPANGAFPMRFEFYANDIGFAPALASVTLPAVQVTGGVFTVPLDVPGLPLDGRSLYVQAVVNGVVLVPRQQLTSAPLAIFASAAGSADLATRAASLRAPGAAADAVTASPSGAVTIPNSLSVGGTLGVTGPLSAGALSTPGNLSAASVTAGAVSASGAVSAASVTTGGVTLSSPVSRTVSFGPADFQPLQSSMGYNRAYPNGVNAPGLAGTVAGATYQFVAPLHLPQGATIVGVMFVLYSATGTQTFNTVLNVTPLGGTVNPFASRFTTPPAGNSFFVPTGVSISVDNNANTYSLVAAWIAQTPATNSLLMGATVTYTVTSPLP